MEITESPTKYANIYICGDYGKLKDAARKFCYDEGLCVVMREADYVYTGGAESGALVSINNYPRFPATTKEIEEKAIALGRLLMSECCQQSFMVQCKDDTKWYSRRKEIDERIAKKTKGE